LDADVSEAPRGGGWRWLIELAQTVVITVLLFLGIQAVLVQPFQVQQNSMQNSFQSGDYVLVDKLTPRWDAYSRGDVIVFDRASDAPGRGTPYIKRVIGVPGDIVEIANGRVSVNGVPLDEPYLFAGPDGAPEPTVARAGARWEIAEGQLFVLGDHREASVDSRSFGPVDVTAAVGRGVVRYWPISAIGIIQTPSYGDVAAP